MNFKKRRLLYFILFLLVIPVGLSTRKQPQWYYSFIADYGGDALWSTMFFFLFRFFRPTHKLWKIALYTYLFSVAIETSQLYHAPWIENLRATFPGRMLLGSGFLWSDMLCYLIGTIIGWVIGLIADKISAKRLINN